MEVVDTNIAVLTGDAEEPQQRLAGSGLARSVRADERGEVGTEVNRIPGRPEALEILQYQRLDEHLSSFQYRISMRALCVASCVKTPVPGRRELGQTHRSQKTVQETFPRDGDHRTAMQISGNRSIRTLAPASAKEGARPPYDGGPQTTLASQFDGEVTVQRSHRSAR